MRVSGRGFQGEVGKVGCAAVVCLALIILVSAPVLSGDSAAAAGETTLTRISPVAGQVDSAVWATLYGTNFSAPCIVYLSRAGQENIMGTNVVVSSSTLLTCIFDLTDQATGHWDVNLQVGYTPTTLFDGFTVTSSPPEPPGHNRTWYLPEGSTAWGFQTYLTIENPNASAVSVGVTYMRSFGGNKTESFILPAASQTTLTNDHLLDIMDGPADFSTKVECVTNSTIAVDRTMTWLGERALSEEAHSSVGVSAPEYQWYLPEGSSNWGFECFILVQNPNSSEASCDFTYMIEGEGPRVVNHVVPPFSRQTYNMAQDIGAKDASVMIESSMPVIPERAMYRNARREGHDSIGALYPEPTYMLAEGSTAWGFTTFVLIQNPTDASNTVTVTLMTPQGPWQMAPFSMPGQSRSTIKMNDVLPDTDMSILVEGTLPLLAERAMYWDNGTGEACHDSIGTDAAHKDFYLPDGRTTGGRETYVLVQNPSATDSAAVTITFLSPGGNDNRVITDTIAPGTRKTYNMRDVIPDGSASTWVSTDKVLIVERAMYWNSRGAGTDTIGAWEDPAP